MEAVHCVPFIQYSAESALVTLCNKAFGGLHDGASGAVQMKMERFVQKHSVREEEF